MLMLIDNAFLDLVEFRTNPRVLFVAVGMKHCQRLQAFLVLTVVNEPPGRLLLISMNAG